MLPCLELLCVKKRGTKMTTTYEINNQDIIPYFVVRAWRLPPQFVINVVIDCENKGKWKSLSCAGNSISLANGWGVVATRPDGFLFRTCRRGWRWAREPRRRGWHFEGISSNRPVRLKPPTGPWWYALRGRRRPICMLLESRWGRGSWEWEPRRRACRPQARCDIDLLGDKIPMRGNRYFHLLFIR